MAYVITNGKYYIKMTCTGAVEKTENIDEARMYLSIEKAKDRILRASGKTRGYYILDIDTWLKYYVSKGRIKFPQEIRERIYREYNGTCALCGHRIKYDDMTLDHIVPLVMGGADNVNNLQCTCRTCNMFKGSILPEDFEEHITDIFMYQMEKKHGNKLRWKIVHRMMERII